MALEKYDEKRDFTKTSEPKAGRSTDRNHLVFVIQKHDASHLHYDFRLEIEGVLKSWAVPKGPSNDPQTKRLAMMVEDHPFDYRDFEGIIPKGQYGGGTVIVWDRGIYEPIQPVKGKAAQEKHLLKQLYSGSIKINMHGGKLKGEFALVKTNGMGENGWLLIKHNDGFASKDDITKLDRSVLSGKTIAEMAKTSEKVWQNGHGEKNIKTKSSGKKSTLPEESTQDQEESGDTGITGIAPLLKNAPRSKMPADVKPMKATLVDSHSMTRDGSMKSNGTVTVRLHPSTKVLHSLPHATTSRSRNITPSPNRWKAGVSMRWSMARSWYSMKEAPLTSGHCRTGKAGRTAPLSTMYSI